MEHTHFPNGEAWEDGEHLPICDEGYFASSFAEWIDGDEGVNCPKCLAHHQGKPG